MYQSLLNCSKNSLNALKKRVASRSESSFLFTERPFFEVDVQLAVPSVRLSPDLDAVQAAMNKYAVAVLDCNKQLWDWAQPNVPVEHRSTFFERVTDDMEIVRVILLLTGSIQGTKSQIAEYLDTFAKHDWLWKSNADSVYEEFQKTSPQLDDYEREPIRFDNVDQEIDVVLPVYNIGALSLNTQNLNKKECADWKIKFSDNLHRMAQSQMETLVDYMKSAENKLQGEIVDIDSLRFVMNVLKEIRERESGIDMDVNPVLDMYAMLEHYLPEGYMDKDEMDTKSVLRAKWSRLVHSAEKVTDQITLLQGGFKKQLLGDVKTFVADVVNFRNDYLANGPMVLGIKPTEAMDRLRRYQEEYDLRARKFELYCGGEELFALKKTEYPELEATKRELGLLQKLYGLYKDVMSRMDEWKTILWSEVVANVDEMTAEMETFGLRCKKMPKKLREWQAYLDLKKKIEDTQNVLPLLQELSKDSIKDRHWDEISETTGTVLEVHDPDFRLESLLAANLEEHQEDIEEICDSADKQLAIEVKLGEVKDKWDKEEFHFNEWKGRGVHILMGVAVTIEELEEDQMNLQTMLTMRHVTPFREEAQDQLKALSDTSETLELWLKVQMLWCSLESVFLGGDIARQMPVVAKKFVKVDKDWTKLMAKAVDTCKVVEASANELLRTSLPVMYAELEKCQKNLEGYLEQKRNKFPRFYFVSNPVLLQVLSQGSDPLAVQAYYEKIFDSITVVEHDRKDKAIIMAMINRDSGAEERIPFLKNVKAAGNIEEWLMDLLTEQKRTMKSLCGDCAVDAAAASASLDSMRGFVDATCAQYALLGLQLIWSADMQNALETCRTKKTIMKDTNSKSLAILSKLSSWCLQDLGSKMNRKKIETLVTIQVHQRDVSNELNTLFKQRKLTSADDFAWLAQARFFWDPEAVDSVNDEGSCVISVTDVDFSYQYEYLGTKERLVITPLTDRCYITLAQAVGMYFGGAPAGPAGTGKTETVKDMGRALGIYVVVTNCSTEMQYTDCAKIFKGLCQSGLWGCFDEFNRIELPVLSVVAQQVQAVNNAKRSGAKFFQFPGDPQDVILDMACGFFITMNPPVKGYAGRQELPENLKALFRGVSMMVPDFEIIIKVKLCSVGYSQFAHLSKKFFIAYALCKEQLSKQRHYDFGLRNILSVLRTAGKTKRDNLEKDEDELLFRTLRDMNLSKLVAQDVPLFLSMLKDVFPTVPPPPKSEHPEVEEQVRIAIDKFKLVQHDVWIGKVIQLYETWLVRHGIMIIGPSGGGKSQVFNTLAAALSVTQGQPFKIVRANPKAFTSQQMFGETDVMTGEWTMGVFSALWEKYNNRNLPYNTWLICDGPVDALWIESMNTVLDDNRILTLASGDRIPMTDNTKIMFENEHLENASPATVSRCGIVYLSDVSLDWAPVVEGWVRKVNADLQDPLRELFKHYVGENSETEFGHHFDFTYRYLDEAMVIPRVGRLASLYTLLESLLTKVSSAMAPSSSEQFPLQLERLFLYSLIWTVNGVAEPEDRAKVDAYLRKNEKTPGAMPPVDGDDTIYEYFVDESTLEWAKWRPPVWTYPEGDSLDFSNLLVPTMDSTRAMYLLDAIHNSTAPNAGALPVLLIGGAGTAKTSTCLMFFDTFDANQRLLKRINFSAFTKAGIFQATIDGELDKRGGKSFGPSNGKKMTVFLDDISMPTINKWGDQPTNEIVRQLIEYQGYYFLEKDKRGDFKHCEDLAHVAAMQHPTQGRNDIPNRLKRQYFIFNMVLPAVASIDDLYGQMLRGRFKPKDYGAATMDVVNKLTAATIELWRLTATKMLPTPAKFHYVFNMRELSRVFQGIFVTPQETITTGGQQTPTKDGAAILLRLWKHECARVFQDKLATSEDKLWFSNTLERVTETNFGDDLAERAREEAFFVDFFREDEYDEDDVFVDYGPKIYEPGGTLENVKARVLSFMDKHNVDHPATPLHLVLFEDALRHLIRVSRIIGMPRGSALLVGVGGSGKQSLTRLSAYIARSDLFQIKLTKSYNVAALFDDLRGLFKKAGHQQKSVTFLFTDAEIKDEAFLEYINSVLMTGEVVGLFAKDEMMGMCADLRAAFTKARPGQADTPENLKRFFIDSARDNLHVVLCMSPVNPRFPIRARMFPGLVSGCTIDWFLPWPRIALINVAEGLLGDFTMEATEEVKQGLIRHVGTVHQMVGDVCDEYYAKQRRRVYQTPKSYLSFLHNYKTEYTSQLERLKDKESRVNLGLQKLIKGAEDVEAMKIVLADEQVKLDKATKETNAMLGSLEVSSLEAQKESAKVAEIKTNCEAEASRITAEKEQCEADLAKAQPFLDQANTAIESIKPAHINEVKKLPKPSDIIRLVFDGVLVLFMGKLDNARADEVTVNKKQFEFLNPSWSAALTVMADTKFLSKIQEFEKDKMNEETIELLSPYMDMEDFNPKVAKSASAAAEGLCTWVRAMKFYQEASKIVKPKLEALAVAEGKLEVAMKALAEAEDRLAACNARLKELQDAFDAQMAEKQRIEDGALALQRKMEQASKLINGLSGERVRWTEDSNNFAQQKKRLVGDSAVACAFISYCGPFNQDFRKYLLAEKFLADARENAVPVSDDVDVISFLADIGTIGDWNLQGLPTDPLSTQNGILVTQAARYPLLIDPQGQALSWIRNKEKENLPLFGVTAMNNPQIKDQLEFCMQEGRALIVANVEEEIDPLLDPVLEKQIIVRGRRKYINIADKNVELHDDFRMYFITRLPNPHFSPELQAKTTVVDFTVTMKGLEEQLLGRVIAKEQKALEDLLNKVLEEVNSNTKALMQLDAELLQRLTANVGNLLDDEDLIDVLANTKAKAAEVKEKLVTADETKRSINEKREQFRPVATRGSVLYFSIVDMSMVNVMYQTSLAQFIELFMKSMDVSEKASLPAKRAVKIVDCMTYLVYRYVNKGLYETDKLLFVFILTVKILTTAGTLEQSEVTTFLRGGAALDINSVRKKPKWIADEAWLNVIELSAQSSFFKALPDNMMRNADAWRQLYEHNEPEGQPVPDFELAINDNKEIGAWLRLLLIRCLRMDRTQLVVKDFIKQNEAMGPRYTDPVTDTIDMIFNDMDSFVPTIFLLSPGADPTDAIVQLAKRKKQSVVSVSLGQGQEPVAMKAMNAAAVNGTWVLLQNCELGLPLMEQMEDILLGMRETVNPDFRLFITCLPHIKFPLGLLQMSTKITNEPPQGLRAGLQRSYNVMVDQDKLERIDTKMWRQLLFALCFLHSIVLERRKFGSLGWCQHYDFNNGDLGASMMFLERHLYAGTISWPTVQYMVAEVQYGGKISDNLDRRLFLTYATQWVSSKVLTDSFSYTPPETLGRIPGDFNYYVFDALEMQPYRDYSTSFPEIDSPEIFGLHPNADLTYRVKEVSQLLRQFGDTQPRDTGGGDSGASFEDVVTEKADELVGRLPEDFVEEEYKHRIKKLGGMEVPLNIFLFQEIQRFQRVLTKVRTMLVAMQQAIRGEVVMTQDLVEAMNDLFDARAPFPWIWTPGMDEFSWDLPPIGLWMSSLLERDSQYRTWLMSGRPTTFWLTGTFNPQGYLTGMKQEVTRQHKAQSWALDDVAYYTEITEFDRSEQVRSAPKEGVYIHGLFLDGGLWSKAEGSIVESVPKKLFAPLPVLYVTAMTNTLLKGRREMFGVNGPYVCPCYKYAERTDRYWIFDINVITRTKKPSHWVLRGVAALCSTYSE